MATSAASHLVIGAATDTGRLRTRNEDSIYVEPPDSPDAQVHGWLGVVADGLGGQPSGDLASHLAVLTTRNAFYTNQVAETGDRLRRAVQAANRQIARTARRSPEHKGMATTTTAVVIRGHRLVAAQVGDSRAYLIRSGRIRRITYDHTVVGELMQRGELTAEQAKHHPHRNVITRALGAHEQVEVDVFAETLRDQDAVLVCSDGLYRFVDEVDIVRSLVVEPRWAAEDLVALANERGGADNISVIIARVRLPEDDDVTLLGHSA